MDAWALAPAIASLILPIARAVQTGMENTKHRKWDTDIDMIVANESKLDFYVATYARYWGRVTTYPAAFLSGTESVARTLTDRVKDELGDGATEAEIEAKLKEEFDAGHDEKVAESLSITTFAGSGRGGGTELALLLWDAADYKRRIVLLLRRRRRIAASDYGGGVSMSYGDWFTDNKFGTIDDPEGQGIIAHIMSTDTSRCKFSHGDPAGDRIATEQGPIAVELTPRKTALFTISDAA